MKSYSIVQLTDGVLEEAESEEYIEGSIKGTPTSQSDFKFDSYRQDRFKVGTTGSVNYESNQKLIENSDVGSERSRDLVRLIEMEVAKHLSHSVYDYFSTLSKRS